MSFTTSNGNDMMDDAQTDYERNEIRETIAMLEQKRTR